MKQSVLKAQCELASTQHHSLCEADGEQTVAFRRRSKGRQCPEWSLADHRTPSLVKQNRRPQAPPVRQASRPIVKLNLSDQ